MTPKELIFLSRKYGMEKIIRQELASGKSPEEILEIYDL